MFYDEFIKLCDAKGVTRSRACIDCGVSRTAWHKWEDGATPNGATINKFAAYFEVSASQLLGGQKEKAPTPEDEREIGFDDFTYAFSGEVKELTPEDKQLLLSMARQLNQARKQRDGRKTD